MLVIRLARTGRTKYPTYRIVAAESARAATGRFVEVLGHYNPHTKELVIKREQVQARLSHGAQPSNTVIKLLLRENIELPAWVKLKTKAAKGGEVAEPASTEVSEAEAAADADAGDADEVRVAEVAEDQVPGTEGPGVNAVDTAASEEAQAEAVEEGSEAVADADTPKAQS